MLEFNPYFRKKPIDFLKMDIFAKLREKYPEFLKAPSQKIQLGLDKKDAFDYNNSCYFQQSLQDLKNELSKEVKLIQKKPLRAENIKIIKKLN